MFFPLKTTTFSIKGILDELKIFDQALSEKEIMDLYSQTPIENAEIDCVTFQEDALEKIEVALLCKM